MSGSTGSVVWWVCCVLVISFCVVLCTDTWARGAVSAVLVVGVLCAHHFVEECLNAFKACGCQICGNWMYPIAFTWTLPSIIGPGVLVTSKTVGNTLLLMCRCKTHDPRLCADCPP